MRRVGGVTTGQLDEEPRLALHELCGSTVVAPLLAGADEMLDGGRRSDGHAEDDRHHPPAGPEVRGDQCGHDGGKDDGRNAQPVVPPHVHARLLLQEAQVRDATAPEVLSTLVVQGETVDLTVQPLLVRERAARKDPRIVHRA